MTVTSVYLSCMRYVTVVTYWIGGEGRGVGARDHEPLRYQVTYKHIYTYMSI